MKIKPEHYAHIEQAINQVLAANPDTVARYEAGNFPRADRVKDLQKRFCFDMLYAALPASWVSKNIYPYADDRHLETALRRICPKVEDRRMEGPSP